MRPSRFVQRALASHRALPTRATPPRSILGRSAAGRACATVASAALVCLASCASSASEVASTQEALCADGATIEFVDVSQHQGTIDWDALRADTRVAGAIIRASNGTRVDDTQFARNWGEAARVGLPRGAYHFYEHCQDPNAQADNFLANLAAAGGSLPTDLPLMLDWEWSDAEPQCSGTPYPAPADSIANIQVFLDRIEAATGKAPLIYTSWVFLNAVGISSGASLGAGVRASILPASFERYPLIVPAYTSDCTRVEVPAPWHRWMAWQFTSTGRRGGIATNVDVNQFNGDAAAFARLFAPPVGPALPDPAASCDYLACTSDGDCATGETCLAFEGIATASSACTIRVCASSRSDLGYVPLDAPSRVFDASVGTGATSVALPGAPADARGVVMNVTMVADTTTSVAAYPGGLAPPSASTTAYAARPRATLSIAAIRSGAVQLDVRGGGRLIVDVLGHLVPGAGLSFHPSPIRRVLDTRAAGGPLAAGESRAIALGLAPGSVAVLNVAAVAPSTAGYLTLTSGSASPTSTSTVNHAIGETIANRAFVSVDASGGVSLFSNAGGLDAVVDLAGVFDTNPTDAYTWRTHAPVRLVDSREGRGRSGDLVAGASSTLSFGALPAGSAGAFVTAHALGRGTDGFLQLYASPAMPEISDQNLLGLYTVSAGIPLVARADRTADVYASAGVGLVLEVDALLVPYAAPPPPPDAAITMADAAVPPGVDAGVALGVDAGVASDASSTLDVGPRGDGGGSGELVGTCACRAAGAPASSRPSIVGLTGLCALALVIARRARPRARSWHARS
ncbi:MAG: GH25 family lysozyme [Sandaracinus sp.]